MLDIEMEFRQGILFARLKGLINGDTASIIESNITDTIINNGIKYLLINLEKVTYIDQYGIDVFKKNYDLIKASHGKFMVCGITTFINYSKDPLEYLYQLDFEERALEVINVW